jgi:hypothetical protein
VRLSNDTSNTATHTSDTPQLLLEHHLKELRLPTMLREYDHIARQCAVEQVDYQRYLLRMTELELLDRERRAIDRRIRQAKFPVVKTLDSFDFLAMPSVNKALVLELARCEFLARRENVLLLGNSGTGKTHIALAQSTLRTGLDPDHFEPAVPGVDRDPRLGTAHRSLARPPHPPRPHPGDERRQLSPQAKPPETKPASRTLIPKTPLRGEEPLPLRSRGPSPLNTKQSHCQLLAYFYSAPLAWFYSALDRQAGGRQPLPQLLALHRGQIQPYLY